MKTILGLAGFCLAGGLLTLVTADAQLPQVTVVGPITVGHCVGFLSTLQLTDNGQVCPSGASGSLVTGGFNQIQIAGAGTGVSPAVISQGGDANVSMNLTTKGSGSFAFQSNSFANTEFVVAPGSGNDVNHFQVNGAATGSPPSFVSIGSDTNIGVTIAAKGNGTTGFFSNGGNNTEFVVAQGSGNDVNHFKAVGTGTGGFPGLLADGTDTNIGMNLATKGSGPTSFQSNTFANTEFVVAQGSGNDVNHLQVAGSATGVGPVLSAVGSDANIPMGFTAKGTSPFIFLPGSSSPAVNWNGLTSGTATIGVGNTGGHFSVTSNSTPSLTAGCNGAGSSVTGSDLNGTVTGQTAAATTCTLTFATAYGTTPNCVVSGQNSPLTGAFTPSTATLVVNFASTANYKWSYVCFGT